MKIAIGVVGRCWHKVILAEIGYFFFVCVFHSKCLTQLHADAPTLISNFDSLLLRYNVSFSGGRVSNNRLFELNECVGAVS